jgi:hypothetical protein
MKESVSGVMKASMKAKAKWRENIESENDGSNDESKASAA